MKEVPLPPRAASLSEAMRDVGYSLEAAVADIIDNSISAGASRVDILFDVKKTETCLAIIDNGEGMSEVELIEAMRHGARNPRLPRSKNDLGRFGLGLKTASFSQCTRLTVVSSRDGSVAGAIWDLKLVSERDDWIVCKLEDAELAAVPHIDRLAGNGTIVIWQNLDRLCESSPECVNEKLINEKIREVEKHLSLVFHRFLSGEIKGRKLEIAINYHELDPFDPFCTANKATQLLNQEIIRVSGSEVIIQPYILPHHSKLSQKEKDFYNSRSDFLNNQGAYVYRNGRLMAWGDWFRLAPKGEATKLARVKIDFPSNLDEHWTIDIKKSRAYPPLPVREQIRKIIGRITEGSTRVIRGRGKRLYEAVPNPVWVRTAGHGMIEYSLDRQHPVIAAVTKSLKENESRKIEEILSIIESSIPVETIYADYTIAPQDFEKDKELEKDEVMDKLESIWNILSFNHELSEDAFREIVCFIKPYRDYADVIEEFIRRKSNE